MTAVTQCPECGTRFKVTDAQLDAHDGLVRCGRCHEVFNAREHMHDDEPSPQLSLPIDAEPLVEAPTSERIEATPEGEDRTETSKAIVADLPLEASAGEPAALPNVPDLEEEMTSPETRQHQFVEELTDEVPHKPSRKRRRIGILAATLLTLALLAQAAYFFRIELAAHLPGLKPGLAQYCSLLGCTVELPKKAELMSIESSELESDRVQSNLITLHALLHNRATFTQGYPSLELTLTDLQDHAVARRVFHPADYLKAGNEVPKGLAANRELEIALRMDTTDLKPSGYRLFLFYPK